MQFTPSFAALVLTWVQVRDNFPHLILKDKQVIENFVLNFAGHFVTSIEIHPRGQQLVPVQYVVQHFQTVHPRKATKTSKMKHSIPDDHIL